MQAVILAGGFGTRLQSVVKNIPKPMAPIQGKPFLAYLIEYLKSQGITRVILSVYYLREQIENFFGNSYDGVDIVYVGEEKPLGTGGAIVNALQHADVNQPVFVLNGDTFLKLNYHAMLAQHSNTQPILTMALRKVADCSRYGVVLTEGEDVVSFSETGEAGIGGLINAGVYLISPYLLQKFPLALEPFSFEKDFLFPQISQLKPKAFVVDDYFIDIGVPEDYARACETFSMC